MKRMNEHSSSSKLPSIAEHRSRVVVQCKGTQKVEHTRHARILDQQDRGVHISGQGSKLAGKRGRGGRGFGWGCQISKQASQVRSASEG